jgi:hypothetical protein
LNPTLSRINKDPVGLNPASPRINRETVGLNPTSEMTMLAGLDASPATVGLSLPPVGSRSAAGRRNPPAWRAV